MTTMNNKSNSVLFHLDFHCLCNIILIRKLLQCVSLCENTATRRRTRLIFQLRSYNFMDASNFIKWCLGFSCFVFFQFYSEWNINSCMHTD